MLFGTLPSPHEERSINGIIHHDAIGAVRFNTGVSSPWSPDETLGRLLQQTRLADIPLWIDLKGRQLRIKEWAHPKHGGKIRLNHAFSVDLPAKIVFRGDHGTRISAIRGNTVYVDPPPKYAVGAGQSVNILGSNLHIHGYLTDQDKAYIKAACAKGITQFMLSFVEGPEDAQQLLDCIRDAGYQHLLPKVEIVLKIESQKGLAYVDALAQTDMPKGQRLMAARDDLMQQIGHNKAAVLPAIKKIAQVDPHAICASRILTSIEKGPLSLGDLADLSLMRHFGYKHFMLCDDICRHKHFSNVMRAWQECYGVVLP